MGARNCSLVEMICGLIEKETPNKFIQIHSMIVDCEIYFLKKRVLMRFWYKNNVYWSFQL